MFIFVVLFCSAAASFWKKSTMPVHKKQKCKSTLHGKKTWMGEPILHAADDATSARHQLIEQTDIHLMAIWTALSRLLAFRVSSLCFSCLL